MSYCAVKLNAALHFGFQELYPVLMLRRIQIWDVWGFPDMNSFLQVPLTIYLLVEEQEFHVFLFRNDPNHVDPDAVKSDPTHVTNTTKVEVLLQEMQRFPFVPICRQRLSNRFLAFSCDL